MDWKSGSASKNGEQDQVQPTERKRRTAITVGKTIISVRIETEVAGQIERQVAQSIQATMKGTEADETEVQKAIDMYAASLKNVTINGLEKKASFWIQTQTVKPGLKKAKSPEDLIIQYTYYVVYVCDQKMFEKQIKSAMEDIEDNTKYADILRQKTTEALVGTLSVGPATTMED